MPKGYTYLLECSNGSFYTGSTIDLEKRIIEHNEGRGANHTKSIFLLSWCFLKNFKE